MVLKEVLLVPKMKCNLISIWQLNKELNCIVTFTDNCVIQGCILRNLIGMGRVKGGVFLHKEVPDRKLQAHAIRTYDLWHGLLGHPSKQVLSLLAKNLNVGGIFSNNVDEPYDICFRARQTCSLFSKSDSKVSELFELIHCDIWGAYMFHRLVQHTIF